MAKSEIEAIITEFQKTYPRPGLNSLVVTWYDVDKEWPKSWPSGKLPGVYIFLDSNEDLLYIGKASSGRSLKTRLRAYFKNNDGVCLRKGKAKDTCYVGFLPLPLEHGFEAPAIEEYMITFCSEHQEYPKLINKVIVSKRKRKIQKQVINSWIKNPSSAPEEIKSVILKYKSEGKL
jgi:hypothetical protein